MIRGIGMVALEFRLMAENNQRLIEFPMSVLV